MNAIRAVRKIACSALLLLVVTGCARPVPSQPATASPTTQPSVPSAILPASPTAAATLSIPSGSRPMIFDDDGSRDGIAALLYLLGRPEFSILAVSVSYGEAHPDVYVQYVGRVLDVLEIQGLPLGAGQDGPLAPAVPFPDFLRQLSDRFWDYPLPETGRTYPVEDAAGLMVSVIQQSPEPVTVFLSGTFTTLAQALRLDPGIRDGIAQVYFMGGAVQVPGNITNLLPESSNLVAEWNIYADPLAAQEVFESGLDLYMVPLDATNPLKLTRAEIAPWFQGDDKAALIAGLYDMMFANYGFETVEIFDLTAAVLTVRPELCDFQSMHLDVIVEAGEATGQTLVDPGGVPNVHVCLSPDIAGLMQEMNTAFASPGAEAAAPSAAPIVGSWEGTASNNGYEMQVAVTIAAGCLPGQVCGQFEVGACSGTWTWVGMDADMYQFTASEKSAGCGEGTDFLLPQQDGSLLYLSRGDYGETQGLLHRSP